MAKITRKRPQSMNAKINRGIARLIEAHASKNYSAAHKYLVGVVEAKLLQKINSHLDKPLF